MKVIYFILALVDCIVAGLFVGAASNAHTEVEGTTLACLTAWSFVNAAVLMFALVA